MHLQVSGIIVGMLLMGFIADQIGRKWGSVLTAAFMFVGGIMLTASNGVTIQGWAIMFAISQVRHTTACLRPETSFVIHVFVCASGVSTSQGIVRSVLWSCGPWCAMG